MLPNRHNGCGLRYMSDILTEFMSPAKRILSRWLTLNHCSERACTRYAYSGADRSKPVENPLCPDLRHRLEAQRRSFSATEEARLRELLPTVTEPLRSLCELMLMTGCRLSEALALRRDCLDTERHLVVFLTLKQRDSGIIRAVPVPAPLMARLASLPTGTDGKLWPISRWTGRRRIRALLLAADVAPARAHTRTFRHSFNDRAKKAGVPAAVRRALLGHRTQAANDAYGVLMGEELGAYMCAIWSMAPPG